MFKRKYFWLEYGIILTFATVGSIVRYFVWDFLELKGGLTLEAVLISYISIVIAWEVFRGVNSYLNKTLPFEKGIARRIGVQLTIGVLFMSLFGTIILSYAAQFFDEPMGRMFNTTAYATYIILSFLINSVFFAKFFFDQWKNGILKTEQLEKEKTQVQFDNLKNQLNPHFLFNSMSSLNSLIYDNQELASDFLQNLSKVYRYVLQNEERTLVPISSELDFIRHFIFLLETRFQNTIHIRVEVDPQVCDLGIVPVTLQVLLENAVKHNQMDEDHPLQIRIYSQLDKLMVVNSLLPKKSVESSNKKGLNNLKSLYAFLTETPIAIRSTEDHFSVEIPLLRIQDRVLLDYKNVS
ncbi:histidine kinase [Algoriphagus sp. AGSA1]|uniref:sensor histidine kinase n=1 Tax=Algoriphagus sp. AGSA1 TaxID=2907213 RepID=UPI001F2D64D6|nr:sensor histidine kinase [Algoriphagus sp. AGSA1]MCE7057427.1 histidine kinase [Algoriphagus sp. AGSA1]